jgi:hypothetical protein
MKKNIPKLLILIIRIFFKKSIKLLEHNGEAISDYPTNLGWYLAPFPMEKGKPFCADNLATTARHSFLKDEHFISAMKAGESRWGNIKNKRDISWRLDIMLSAVSYSLKISNESSIFVECGTGKGYMAAAICDYFKNVNNFPNFFLIDSFMPHIPDIEGNQDSGNVSFVYSDGDSEVRTYFEKFEQVKVMKGYIPKILENLPNENEISFLHLDLNSAIAEKEALEYLSSRIQKGGIILFDDYGYMGSEEQALIHEKFSNKMNFRLFTFPTGQAMFINI